MVATATLMKRKEAPQMRLSKSSITKFRSDIVSSFSKNSPLSKTAWGMELEYFELRIANFGLKVSI